MKKRLFSLFLAALLVTALLTGCGSSGESADPGNALQIFMIAETSSVDSTSTVTSGKNLP